MGICILEIIIFKESIRNILEHVLKGDDALN
jgi:amino acid permease